MMTDDDGGGLEHSSMHERDKQGAPQTHRNELPQATYLVRLVTRSRTTGGSVPGLLGVTKELTNLKRQLQRRYRRKHRMIPAGKRWRR